MKKWTEFAHPDKAYQYDDAALKKHWKRLHRGDCEPLPEDAASRKAWAFYHAGEFRQAMEAGRKQGGAAVNADGVVVPLCIRVMGEPFLVVVYGAQGSDRLGPGGENQAVPPIPRVGCAVGTLGPCPG